jgi:multiple sugar transport system permease protein
MNTAVEPTTVVRTEPRVSYASRKTLEQILKYVVLIGIGLLFAFPFVWLVLTSLKSASEIISMPPTLFPKEWQWENYQKAVTAIPFFRYMGNTVLIFVLKAVGAALSCSLAAYGFAMLRWPGRDVVFVLVLATMMLPFQVTMIPLYILYDKLDWIGTFRPLIVPSWFGYAFSIFMFRQFFRTIPMELVEASRIDGCSEPRIWAQVVMPLAKPALAALILFEFMWTWNDFLAPLLYLSKEANWTLALGLLQFRLAPNQWELLMAASTLMVLRPSCSTSSGRRPSSGYRHHRLQIRRSTE